MEKTKKTITLPENPTCVSFSFGICWWDKCCCHTVLAMTDWPAGWLSLLYGWLGGLLHGWVAACLAACCVWPPACLPSCLSGLPGCPPGLAAWATWTDCLGCLCWLHGLMALAACAGCLDCLAACQVWLRLSACSVYLGCMFFFVDV